MKQGLEHNTSTENDGEDGDRFENSSKTSKTGIERTEKSARASNESKLEDAESNASLKSNGTKLSTGNESMATESVEAPVGRNRHRQNESEESQGDSTEKNATIQARSENDTVAEAEEELRKLQDALRTAERRAAKAEADLQAEKAWVSNALRNYSEEAAPHHEKKMSHEALADLAQVLMSFENRDIRDAAKKPQDGTKLEDGADEEGVGNAIEESIREENARQRMRHKYVNKDKAEDGPDRTDGTDEDSDGSSVTEESSEEPETSHLQKHKPWRKHKSHKHKKGGFHVYVEADGGLLEQSSRKVPHE